MFHWSFVWLAKQATGFGSNPKAGMPSFLYSTIVVPVPQNGSSTW